MPFTIVDSFLFLVRWICWYFYFTFLLFEVEDDATYDLNDVVEDEDDWEDEDDLEDEEDEDDSEDEDESEDDTELPSDSDSKFLHFLSYMGCLPSACWAFLTSSRRSLVQKQ